MNIHVIRRLKNSKWNNQNDKNTGHYPTNLIDNVIKTAEKRFQKKQKPTFVRKFRIKMS